MAGETQGLTQTEGVDLSDAATPEAIESAMRAELGEQPKAPEPAPKEAPETPETPETPEPTPEARTAEPARLKVKGKDYTEEQLDEFIRNGMRQSEFSRRMNEFRKEQEIATAERNSIREFIAELRGNGRGKEEQEDLSPEDRIARLEQHIAHMAEERQIQQDREAKVELFRGFQSEVGNLMTEHGLDPKGNQLLHQMISSTIVDMIPGAEMDDREVFQDQLREAFGKVLTTLQGMTQKQVDTKLETLKKLPQPPSAPAGSAATMKGKEKPRPHFDDGNELDEAMEEMRRGGMIP